jgi:23S rRNA pseudouridine1911/1915/1917 synthase
MIACLKRHQGIYVNGKPEFANYIFRQGDRITIDLVAVEPAQSVLTEHSELAVMYEDEYVLAVYKPEGMLTHPSRTQFTGTLMGFVLGYLSHSGVHTCHAINSLDRYTSGIVLFAKNAYAKALFTDAMRDAHKEYIAVTYGRVRDSGGTIDLPIDRLKSGNIERGVTKDGARATTHYELLNAISYENTELSVLKLRPETGRSHQLRVHCLALGYPIVGDHIYHTAGSKAFSEKLGIRGQLLHAERLRFIHPVSQSEVDIHSDILRGDMQGLISTTS